MKIMAGRVGGDKSGGLGGWGTGEVIFQLFIFLKFYFLSFYSIFKITPHTPPYPPIIYFMIRYIYINILKVSGMVRERTGGVGGGVVDFVGG